MAKKRDWIIGLLIFFSFLFVAIIFAIGFFGVSADRATLGISGQKVGIVELNGLILESQEIVKKIKKLQDSRAIRAVVLRIDSPGGGVAASQEIYEAVKSMRDSKKPIVVSMGSVAASGGYYVACGADSILANPGTTTGSIGVILEAPNFKDLLDRWGIKFNVIKSGPFKDTGSPYHDMEEKERKYLQRYIDDAFQQFVDVVVENRNLSREEVLQLADGRVFTGKQAFENGLLDRLGNYQDAIKLAATLAGIKGEPETYRFPKRKFTIFDLIFSDLNKVRNFLEATPALKYQYTLGTL